MQETCIQLVALMNSKLLDGWPLTSRDGDAGVWKEVDRAIAQFRTWIDPGTKDAAPYRIAARMLDAETYDRILHDGMRPREQIDHFAARHGGLMSPGLTPLDAYYWRWVVMRSTFKHTLALEGDADFGVMEHIRFLGLFRPGGQLRPKWSDPTYDQEFEDWIAALVPEWFVRFATDSLIRFKFWIEDDPTPRGDGKEQTFWSENHQISFTSSELVAGLFWPFEGFTHQHRGVTRTGEWHAERAARRAERWLRDRLRFGFSEVNSPVYYNVQIPALLNLLDFLPDAAPGALTTDDFVRLRTLTLMVLDLIVFDVVLRVCQGSFVTASPRGYLSGRSSGWGVSIRDFIEILTGTLGEISSAGEQSAVSLATSRYVNDVPECLILIARHQSLPFVARTRTSINLSEGIDYGIGTESGDDIMFWWGHSAYFTPQTYRASQSWSVRWHLRDTEPFSIFEKVDGAAWRLVHGAAGGLSTLGMWVGLQALYPPLALLMTPRAIRSVVDVISSVLDFVAAGIDLIGKELGLLDENNDRVRLAKTAVEQEFERALVEFNAGSVMQREHLYVWRSADAMLSSLVDDHKAMISAQKLTCVANLGPDVSVFVGKPLEMDLDLGTYLEAGAAGLEDYLEFWKTVPGAMNIGQDPIAPEVGELGRVAALDFEEKSILAAGPNYWDGDVSNPLVWQRENVAVVIHQPTSHQKDISANTHAHWPWDHFDEVDTREASGGRWVFGRRDRRWPPRTPCAPREEFRPGAGADEHWPIKAHRRDPDPSNGGAGYVALFSAAGLKTRPSKPTDPLGKEDVENNAIGWGHRELIADGHDNVWIIAVGDELTYGSFNAFRERILACQLEADVDEGTCVFELPTLSGPKQKIDVSFEDEGKVHLPATAERPLESAEILETRFWPRFNISPSEFAGARPLRFGIRGGEHMLANVDWKDARWQIYAAIKQPDPKNPRKMVDVELSVYHDFREGLPPRRIVHNLPPGAGPIGKLGGAFRTARRDMTADVRRRL